MCRNVKLALIQELSQADRAAQSTLGAPLKEMNEGWEEILQKRSRYKTSEQSSSKYFFTAGEGGHCPFQGYCGKV